MRKGMLHIGRFFDSRPAVTSSWFTKKWLLASKARDHQSAYGQRFGDVKLGRSRRFISIAFRTFFSLVFLSLVAMPSRGEDVTYYYTDQVGSIIATTNASGTVVSLVDFRPYGAVALGLPQNGPGYGGHIQDVDSGFSYMQQRYYDPALQRFISVDPVNYVAGNVIKFNRYSYANLNPFGYSDPDGRDPEWYSNVDPMGNPGAGNPLGGVAITSGVGAFALLGGAAAIPEVVGAAGPEIAEGVGSNLARTAGQQLSREARRGIASLERRILEHRAKLEAFKANPTVR